MKKTVLKKFVCILVVFTALLTELAAQDVAVFPQLGHSDGVTSVAFSPDGRQVLSGSMDKAIKLWGPATGMEIRTFSGHTKGVNFVAFSPDGRQILSGSIDKTIKLWDTATGKEIRTFSGHTEGVNSVAFSPDGRQILSGSMDKTIKLWDTAIGKEIRTFSGHTEGVNSVAFSPDGRQVLSGSRDGTIKLWDVTTGREIRTFSGHTEGVNSVAFSPDGRQILSGSGLYYDHGGTIKLWDAATGREIITFSGHTDGVHSVTFSPDGRQVLSGSEDKTIKLWDVATGMEIRTFSGRHKGNVSSVAFSPDGRQVLSSLWDIIKLWDTATGEEIRIFSGYSGHVKSVAFSIDSRQVLSDSEDNTVKLWDVTTGRELRTFMGYTSAFSPDGKQVLSGLIGPTVKLWDVATGRELRTFSRHTNIVSSIAFSPDGRQVLSGSWDGTIKLWDAITGKEVRTFSGHTSYVLSVAFSPDGRHVLSSSYDGTVRLWDASTGKEIAQFIWFYGDEWIVITPEGYYNASPNGDNFLNVRIGNNVYGIDQYRKIFYRPDIVITALSGNPAAYQAMVKEAGANINNAVPPPRVKIEPMRSTQAIKTEKTEIKVTINDDNLEIKNVWINVNGRLAAGKSVSRAIAIPVSGLNVTGKDKKMFFTVSLDVEDGSNVVEVFASNGYAEGRDVISFSAEIRQALPDLWMLAIGVNDYSSPLVSDLSYAVNDAKELAEVFKGQEGKRYGKVNILVIADGEKQKPVAAAIRESFAWFKQAKDRDLCILFIAGHAVNDSGGNYYFLPADAAFDASGSLNPVTAISHKEINSVLDMPGRKLFILDTCHSAGAGKTGLADTNSFIRQAMEYYPVIFSSSRGSELSQEKPEYRHGLFTYGIIKGIGGEAVSRTSGAVTMKSLDSYVSEIVSELSNGSQNPTTITPNGYVNFILSGTDKK